VNDATRLGLDVHKETIAVAILLPGQEIADERVIANTPEAVRSLVNRHRCRGGLVACYEAGPTGYDTGS
jgi:transposase